MENKNIHLNITNNTSLEEKKIIPLSEKIKEINSIKNKHKSIIIGCLIITQNNKLYQEGNLISNEVNSFIIYKNFKILSMFENNT